MRAFTVTKFIFLISAISKTVSSSILSISVKLSGKLMFFNSLLYRCIVNLRKKMKYFIFFDIIYLTKLYRCRYYYSMSW
jgi:hypothetical protein